MKQPSWLSILVLLLLVFIPRDSSSNPIPLNADIDEELAKISSPAVYDEAGGDSATNLRRRRTVGTLDSSYKLPNLTYDITYGAKILRESVDWLKENIHNSQFDEDVLQFERDIAKLPSDLVPKREEILEELYKGRDSIITRRALLMQVAKTLKIYCNNLIDIYNNNDPTPELLKFSATKFVEYAEFVQDILQKALNETKVLNDQLAGAKAYLVDYTAKLNERAEKIELNSKNEYYIEAKKRELRRNLEDIMRAEYKDRVNLEEIATCVERFIKIPIYDIKECLPTYITSINNGAIFSRIEDRFENIENIAYPSKAEIQIRIEEQDKLLKEIEEQNVLLEKIGPAGESGKKVTDNIEAVSSYLTEDRILINNWSSSLSSAVNEMGEDGLDPMEIEFNISGIKRGLNDLIESCDAYLNHEVPDILLGKYP